MAAPQPIRLEVVTIDCEHLSYIKRLRGDNQGSIREIHRMIRIHFHKFENTCKRSFIKEPDEQAAIRNEFSKPAGAHTVRLQKMERLNQYRDCRVNWLIYACESL